MIYAERYRVFVQFYMSRIIKKGFLSQFAEFLIV